MKIGITKLIPENIAPTNANGLAIFDGDTKICTVAIDKMHPDNIGDKLYSFGVISDTHIYFTSGYEERSNRLDAALTFFENQGASFVCHCGDMTNIGFWYTAEDTEIYPYQFAEYKRICDLHSELPVYAVCGNHESYNKSIANNLAELEEYTGHGLAFTVTQGNDVFVFVGQSVATLPMSDEHLQWLYETLEANRNKRTFVVFHSVIDDTDAGDPSGAYVHDLFDNWGTKKTAFINMMRHYRNTISFHGHTHVNPNVQTKIKNVNYSTVLGLRSMHIPSTAYCRGLIDGALVEDSPRTGFCYIADVYENHVVFKCYDIVTSEFVPIAQYCINMEAVEIPANTFVDSTGTIITNQQ